MSGKRVLLIGGNYFPEPTGIGKYNGEMMDWLSEHGYDCSVITTFPYYPHWKVDKAFKKNSGWYKKEMKKNVFGINPIKIIRCPHYVPANPSGLRRIISDSTFLLSSFFVVTRMLFQKKYDYVITVAPPFSNGLLATLYKKIKGAKTIYHIQDLQIDAARELKMVKSAFVLKMLKKVEKYILNHSTLVSTISSGMARKVEGKCEKNIVHFPNWVDTRAFFPIKDKAQLKASFGYDPKDKIVLYSGAIGEKQGLESMAYVAQLFANDKHVKFVICGSGPYKKKLQALKESIGLDNVIFKSTVSPKVFNSFLNAADIHLVLQKSQATDLVMPSKLTTILAVGGILIVTANAGTGLHDFVKESGTGIVIEPENNTALYDAIQCALATDHAEMKNKARVFALDNLSVNNILTKFAAEVLDFPIANNESEVRAINALRTA